MHDDAEDRNHGGFFPPPSRPRSVPDGIRAQAARGPIGSTWWSRRWLAALEALGVGSRLAAGRSYARTGQVADLAIATGGITAVVQGTRSTPYAVRVEVAQISQGGWLAIAEVLAAQAGYRAALLAGRMPDDVEAAVARTDCSLFPAATSDLELSCSCPDWAPACKHVAAACYLAGEAFDRDPFLVFRMRGVERDVLLALIAGHAARTSGMHGWEPTDAPRERRIDADAPTPTSCDPGVFWGEPDDTAHVTGQAVDLEGPPVDAPLVRVLGPPPMWRGAEPFETVMRRVHRRAATGPAVDAALGGGPP